LFVPAPKNPALTGIQFFFHLTQPNFLFSYI
jgi:hypothetical protein